MRNLERGIFCGEVDVRDEAGSWYGMMIGYIG